MVFKIKCPSLNFNREYEVCYFRKYWGLRDKILKILDIYGGIESYRYPVDILQIKMLKSLFEHYCDIDNIREAELSTVWNEIEECHHIRDEYEKIRFAKDFCDEKISLYEFIYALSFWEETWNNEPEQNKILIDWLEKHQGYTPNDLEWCFEFYDSY